MRFYLGTHEPSWLARSRVPLFLSAIRLRRYGWTSASDVEPWRRRARSPWALDSGGFSELDQNGRWTVGPLKYAREAEAWAAAIGRLEWAAIQDWMCEPFILAKTGKTVAEHQRLTIQSLADLRTIAPSQRWVPVVQGWRLDDYLSHVEQYAAAGFDLRAEARVGVGSVCRRQGTREAAEIMRAISGLGIRVHAFGVKTDGLKLFGDVISSADSMAWSYVARKRPIRLAGHKHVNCGNCFEWAMRWRDSLASGLAGRVAFA